MNLLCALLSAAVGSVLAVHLVFLAVMILASLAAYFWLRELFSPGTALLGAISFSCTDYVMRESLARGALAEAAALMFFGWCLWAVERAFARGDRSCVPLIALFFGGLVLSHNLSMIFCGPALVAYIGLARLRYGDWPCSGLSAAMPFFGLAVSSFFWLPTYLYSEWLNTARYVGFVGELAYMTPAQLFSIGHTSLAVEVKRRLAFSGFTLAGAMGLGCLVFDVGDRQQRRFAWTMVLGVVLTFFMMSEYAAPLFEWIEMLQFLQFPWRMFVLVSFFMCGLGAFAFQALARSGSLRRSVLVALVLGPPVLSALAFAKSTEREDRPVPRNVQELRALGNASFTFEDVSAHRCVPLGRAKRPVNSSFAVTGR
ncbi:MAG: glycosyltransferase family 39 protein, partial [Myxococcota bacterium]